MTRQAIIVERLSKKYALGGKKNHPGSFREMLIGLVKNPIHRFRRLQGNNPQQHPFWALNDISFDVREGEVLGIIGSNGAGKSTLLKILSRITAPTHGKIQYRGRLASLLEVGTGFHPELTGKENIFINGAILGMSGSEIRRKFDEIVDFSGIEEFIETPVKRYSSGMYVRLAFAVAAHLDPDILVIDEVLAVGDASFKKKCMGKMDEVSQKGRTVLFVSHNMLAIQSLCDRALLLSKGKLAFNGDVDLCIKKYKANSETERLKKLSERKDRTGNRKLVVDDFWIEDQYGIRSDAVATGDPITLVIRYKSNEKLAYVNIAVNFYDVDGYILTNLNNEDIGCAIKSPPRKGFFLCHIPSFPLKEGSYRGNIWIEAENRLSDWIKPAFDIRVENGDFYGTGKMINQGKFATRYSWSLKE